jgi:hypothetical protein
VFLCFRSEEASIRHIHLWDGPTRFYAEDNAFLVGSTELPWIWKPATVVMKPVHRLVNGLGISIGLNFPSAFGAPTETVQPSEITLLSAGARFVDGFSLLGPLRNR